MAKKSTKKDVEKSIKDLVKKEISNITNDEQDFEEDLLIDEDQLKNYKDEELLNKLLSSFPSTEGFYGKLYRRSDTGKLEFKHHLDILEEIEDPELEILNLIKEKGWRDGDYILRVFKRGQADCKRTISWKINTESINKQDKSDTVENKLSELSAMMNIVKDISGNSNNNNNSPELVAKIIADSFKSGVESLKQTIPTESDDKLEKTIVLLKNLGLVKDKSDENSNSTNMVNMLSVLKELGIFGQKEEKQDIFKELLKFKELGIIKFANEEKEKEDPLSQIAKIKELIDVITPLAGLGSNEKTSLGIELVKVLGPQVPKIVENITGTINNIAEVTKLKTAKRLNIPIEKNILEKNKTLPVSDINNLDPYNTQDIYDNQDINTTTTDNRQNGDTEKMNPIIKKIKNAIENNDQNFYSELKDIIVLYIGQNALDSLLNNEVTIKHFLSSIGTMFNANFLVEQQSETYFTNFILWYNGEIIKNIINTTCDKCHMEYQYTNENEFNEDSKVCTCGGKIVKITESVENLAK